MRAAISKMSAKISTDSYPEAAKLLLHVCSVEINMFFFSIITNSFDFTRYLMKK